MTSLTEPLVLLLFRSCSPRHPPLYPSLSLSLSHCLSLSHTVSLSLIQETCGAGVCDSLYSPLFCLPHRQLRGKVPNPPHLTIVFYTHRHTHTDTHIHTHAHTHATHPPTPHHWVLHAQTHTHRHTHTHTRTHTHATQH